MGGTRALCGEPEVWAGAGHPVGTQAHGRDPGTLWGAARMGGSRAPGGESSIWRTCEVRRAFGRGAGAR